MCLRYCGDEYGAYTLEYYATLRKGYLAKGSPTLNESLKQVGHDELDKLLGYTEEWEVL